MITNYDKFLDNRLNEGLWDSIKNMFGKLLQNISDELKKPITDLTNKLSKTKDPKQIQTIIFNYLKVHNTMLANELKKATDPVTLQKVTEDNLRAIYAATKAFASSLGEDKFSLATIFADSPASMKKLMDKNEKIFDKNVKPFSINIVAEEAGKNGYNKEEVIKQLSNPKPEAQKNTTTEVKKESILIEEFSKLFEKEGDPATGDMAPDAKVQPGTPAETDTTKQTDQIADAAGEEKPAPTTDDKKNAQTFQKLKDGMKKWFDLSIYKKINDTVKKNLGEQKEGGTVEDKIKNMQSTKNKESVNKIVDALTKTDKDKLKTVRDTLGLDKTSAPL